MTLINSFVAAAHTNESSDRKEPARTSQPGGETGAEASLHLN